MIKVFTFILPTEITFITEFESLIYLPQCCGLFIIKYIFLTVINQRGNKPDSDDHENLQSGVQYCGKRGNFNETVGRYVYIHHDLYLSGIYSHSNYLDQNNY